VCAVWLPHRLLQAAGADATSKKSGGDVALLLETALLYLEADKAIDVATASRRVSPMVRNTLETKQASVHKRKPHTHTL
jgi:hypothetical protein